MVASFLPPGSIKPYGWVAHQARSNLQGFLGQLPNISPEVGSRVFSSGRLGKNSRADNIADVQWWNGESEGNWLWAWSAHLRLVGTEEEQRTVDARFEEICDAGAPDGYIGMFDQSLRGAQGIPGDPWTQSRVLGALRDWAIWRQNPQFISAWTRAINEFCERFPNEIEDIYKTPEKETYVRGHDLQIIDELAEAHTINENAGKLALAIYDAYSNADLEWIEDDCQYNQLISDSDFHGHGPHVVENLRIPLRVAENIAHFEPDLATRLTDAVVHGWNKIQHAIGVSGAIRSDETVGSPHENSLPLPETGREYCAITELTLTLLHIARATNMQEPLDLAEKIWLNAAQAGRAKDGGGTTYCLAENQIAASANQGTRWDISPTHDDAAVCCVPNAGRILPIIVDSTVVADDEGANIWFYTPSEANLTWQGQEIQIRQETDFPFEDNVQIYVSGAPSHFALTLRKPSWAETIVVEPGSSLEASTTDKGISLTGEWADTTVISVSFTPQLRTVESIDGRFALQRGPLIFSQEVAAEWHSVRPYENSNLADRDVIPSESAEILAPYLLRDSASKTIANHVDVPTDPWSNPPLSLNVPVVKTGPKNSSLSGAESTTAIFVPMGATTLRHTCLGQVSR